MFAINKNENNSNKSIVKPNNSEYSYIFNKHCNLFQGIGLLPGENQIHIDPNAPPHIDVPRRIPFKLRDRFKAELDRMIENKIIEKVNEPCKFISSVVCVEKPNGNLRVCFDPRYDNKYIIRQKLNIPTIDTLTSDVNGAKIFSVFDASVGFWSLK